MLEEEKHKTPWEMMLLWEIVDSHAPWDVCCVPARWLSWFLLPRGLSLSHSSTATRACAAEQNACVGRGKCRSQGLCHVTAEDWGHRCGTGGGAGHGRRRPTWGLSSLPQPDCFQRVSARCSARPALPTVCEDHERESQSLAENQAAGCSSALRYLQDVVAAQGRELTWSDTACSWQGPGANVQLLSSSVVAAARSPSPCSGVFTSADVNWARLQFPALLCSLAQASAPQAADVSSPWWRRRHQWRVHPSKRRGQWSPSPAAQPQGLALMHGPWGTPKVTSFYCLLHTARN